VQRENLEAEKIRLKRAKLEQDNQRLALDREKFEGLKTKLLGIRDQAEKAKKAMEAAKARGGELPQDVEKQILAIYGLTEAN